MKNQIYSEHLDELFNTYKGENYEILCYIPDLFKTVQKIHQDDNLNWTSKMMLNACLSYFAIEEDVIPDDVGAIGYIDDLFMCVYVLRNIFNNTPSVVLSNWTLKKKPDVLLPVIFEQCTKLLGEKAFDVLRLVGLLKFEDLAETKEFLMDSIDPCTKLERISTQLFDLLGVLKTILISQGKKLEGRKIKHYIETFSKEEWKSVQAILKTQEEHSTKFDSQLEDDMEKMRRKVILGIDEGIFSQNGNSQ